VKKIIIVVVIILLTIISFFVIWPKRNKPVGEELPIVSVQKGNITEKAQAIGYIGPVHSSTVKSSVNGTVAKIYHYEGEFVHKGDLLLEVNPEPEPSDYAATYASLQEAIVTENSAKKNLKRYKDALKVGLISSNYTDYIDAERNYKNAKEQRLLAQQKLALMDNGSATVGNKPLSNTVISPIDGYILNREVDVGDAVLSLSSAQSATALFTIANMEKLMFKGSVDEIDVSRIKLNMPTVITIGALAKQVIHGELSKISLQSEQKSAEISNSAIDSKLPFNVSFNVEVTNLNAPPGLVLRSGYSATADIEIQTKKDILVLPTRLLHFKDENHIYVLLPPVHKGEKPREQSVTVGLTDGIQTEIINGLKLGDKVLDQVDVQKENE